MLIRPASPGSFSRLLKILAIVVTALPLCGCGTVRYLWQAGRGQLELVNRARPIPQVLEDPKTPARLKALLGEIPRIKAYGEIHRLKPTTNYTDYVKLDRRAAVWVVSACEPLRFKAKEWSFPIVGSFPYLGWFDLGDARRYAEELKKERLDVDVRGAGAFSTLGWFRDAVLSTMIADGDEALGDLVNVILHESVHATFYIEGQSYFNESIASFVADHLTVQYLEQRPETPARERLAYVERESEGRRRTLRFHQAYEELDRLYQAARPESEKLVEKARILTQLKSELGYIREINNATLIQFKTYHDGSADFEQLLKACKGDWPRFWTAIGKLSKKSFKEAQLQEFGALLGPLADQGC